MRGVWPKWVVALGAVAVLTLWTSALGLFGNRPYLIFIVFWLACAAALARVRRPYPDFLEAGIVVAWFFLACMAVFIGVAFFR